MQLHACTRINISQTQREFPRKCVRCFVRTHAHDFIDVPWCLCRLWAKLYAYASETEVLACRTLETSPEVIKSFRPRRYRTASSTFPSRSSAAASCSTYSHTKNKFTQTRRTPTHIQIRCRAHFTMPTFQSRKVSPLFASLIRRSPSNLRVVLECRRQRPNFFEFPAQGRECVSTAKGVQIECVRAYANHHLRFAWHGGFDGLFAAWLPPKLRNQVLILVPYLIPCAHIQRQFRRHIHCYS